MKNMVPNIEMKYGRLLLKRIIVYLCVPLGAGAGATGAGAGGGVGLGGGGGAGWYSGTGSGTGAGGVAFCLGAMTQPARKTSNKTMVAR